ncbi:hypothetical protein, partial [Mycoplasma sp. Z473B]|uniref:hypothetical protein n=1 Tax=Mycoplasma sp. Z473B TaxID=3401667 RepID=UPI003AACEB40
MKLKRKIIIPLAGLNALILPVIGSLSSSGEKSLVTQNFGGQNSDFSGTFLENTSINIIKNGKNTVSDNIFGNLFPSMETQNLEWTNVSTSYDVYQEGKKYSSSSLSEQLSKNYQNVVQIVDITPSQSGTALYASSTSRVRTWRATFNNYYVPANPKQTNSISNSHFIPDGYGNMGFGIMLSKNLQLVNNSVRIASIIKDKNYNATTIKDNGKPITGYLYNMLNKDYSNISITGDVVYKNPTSNEYVSMSPEGFQTFWPVMNKDNMKDFYNETYWSQFDNGFNLNQTKIGVVNNLKYYTIDPNLSWVSTIQKNFLGNNQDFSSPTDTAFNSMLGQALLMNNGSGLKKTFDNAGSILYGQVTNGNWWNRNSNNQVTIVMEFQTIDNQSDFGTSNHYAFMNNEPGSISAVLTWYRGNYGWPYQNTNGNFVAANTVLYDRSQYRTINVEVSEKAITSPTANQNKLENYFIANGYGYELWYENTKIGEIPSDVIDQAKLVGYNKDRKEFTINLKFNSDTSKWPEEMKKSYSSFMNPQKLILKRKYKVPSQEAFFTSNSNHDMNSAPTDNGLYNVGGTFLDTNSLKYDGKIKFYDYSQWVGSSTNKWGFDKLNFLNWVNLPTGETSKAGKNSIYKGQSYSFTNTKLLDNQLESFYNGAYNDWIADNFTQNAWWTKSNDIKQGIYDINSTLSSLPDMTKINKYYLNPLASSNNDTKQFLNLDNFINKKAPISTYLNFLFADKTLKEQYMNAYDAIQKWQNNSTPNFEIVGTNIVDKNAISEKFKKYVDDMKNKEISLENFKGKGFKQGEELTSVQFIQEAFDLIDNAALYSIQYKNEFKNIILQQTNRDDVISYVNAILSLSKKYTIAKDVYETYLPVSTDASYKNIQNTDNKNNDSSYNSFLFSLEQMKDLLAAFEKYQEKTVEMNLVETSALITLDRNINPNNIVEKYQSITSDITAAIALINSLANIPNNDKNAYSSKLWNIVANNGTFGDKYRLLENYSAREAQIAMIISTAKMQSLLLDKNKNVSSFNQEVNLDYSSFEYTNNITKNNQIIDASIANGTSNATIISSNNAHEDLPYVMNGNNKVYIIPNTTSESASVNYYWQTAAKDYINSNKEFSKQTEMFDKINQASSTQLSTYLFNNFTSSLTYNSGILLTEQKVNEFYKNREQLLNAFITEFQWLNSQYSSKTGSRINRAQYNFYIKKFIDLIFTQSMGNNATEITNGINEIKTEVTELQSSMGQLKEVLDKYILPSKDADASNNFAADPKDNIFQNGQFYGLGNLDKFASLQEGKYTFTMPENNGKLIALISTALQVLETLPSKINVIANGEGNEEQLVQARTGYNLPSVLRTTTFDKQIPYNWFVYNKEQISKLTSAITSTATSLDGRYEALSNYYAYAINKYFSSINSKNESLLGKSSIEEVFNSLNTNAKLLPEKQNYQIENDSEYYYQITKAISDSIKNAIISLNNLSEIEKTALAEALSNGENSINFYSLIIGRTDQPQWLWKAQAILYQAVQINDYKESLINKLSSYSSLNKFQISSFTKTIKGWNLVDNTKWSISNVSNTMPSEYSELKDRLHLLGNAEELSNISDTNEQMAALRKFYTEKLEPLKINQPDESTQLKLAKNRQAFMTIFNEFSNPDEINETNWSTINKILENIKSEYDNLNGYNVKLQNDINGVDNLIKDFVTQTEFSKVTDISKLPIISSLEEYNKQYKAILGKLANEVKGKINAQPNLTQAQKNAYTTAVDVTANKTGAQFNDLKTTFEGVDDLNTTMSGLKNAWTNAKAFKEDNKNNLNNLTSQTNTDFEAALAKANIVFAPYSESETTIQNISNVDAKKLTSDLNSYIEKLKKEILDKEKETIIKQINNALAPINEQSPSQAQQAKSDLTQNLSIADSLDYLKSKLQKAKNIIAAMPIYKAIDTAQNINNKSDELTRAIATAEQELEKIINQKADPESQNINQVVNDLNNAVKLDELENEIKIAQKLENPSQELSNAIKAAQTVANSKETAKYDAQISALKDAIKKEPLYKAIANAKTENESLKNPLLTSAIKNAESITKESNLTDQAIQNAVDKLNEELNKAKENKKLLDGLNKAIAAAKKQNNSNSGLLHDLIENAKKIVLQGPLANSAEISNATKQLEYGTELDKLIKVNADAQQKVTEADRSQEMKSNIADVDRFINNWTKQINDNISDLSPLESNAQFTNDINTKIAKTYQTTNANNLYKTADALTAANPEPFTKDLKPYFNNFTKNANELYNQIPASVSDDKFDDSLDSKNQNLVDALNANANYYELAKLADKAKAINAQKQSQALKDALADASTILGVKNSELTIAANNDFNNVFNPIINSLKQENLKNKTDKANELLAQAKADLASAINKNSLENSLANANEIMKLLKGGQIVIPDEDKNIELSIEQREKELAHAIEKATQALKTPEKEKAFYDNAADELDKTNLIAKELISKLKEALKSEVTTAQAISPTHEELSNSIKKAESLIDSATSTATALVDAIYELKKLEAKAKLNNAINSIPKGLENSNSYKELVLQPAQTVLNNSASTVEDFNNATNKLESDKNKVSLFNAYDQAVKALAPVDPKLASAIEQAKTILTDPNNEYLTADKNFFDEKAKELTKLLSNNNLNNLIYKAELVQPKSTQLTDAIEKAKKAQETIDTNTAEQNQAAIDALQDALNKNTLQNTISNAEKLLNSFTPKEGQQATDESTKNKNALETAIQLAKAALTSPSNSTKEQYNTEAGELQKVVTASEKVLSDAKNELVKQAKELNQKVQDGTLKPSAGLSAAIQKDLNPSETDNYLDYVQAKKELTYLQDSNNLANAINSMPQLDPNISGINTTNISQASQNTLANKELAANDYDTQANKQNALNDVINAA